MENKAINWVLLEDEYYTAVELRRVITADFPEYHNIATFERCCEFREFIDSGHKADLIISNVDLADGPVFSVFNKIKIEIPVILTTSYDDTSRNLLPGNIVHILPRPVSIEDLRGALRRFEGLNNLEVKEEN